MTALRQAPQKLISHAPPLTSWSDARGIAKGLLRAPFGARMPLSLTVELVTLGEVRIHIDPPRPEKGYRWQLHRWKARFSQGDNASEIMSDLEVILRAHTPAAAVGGVNLWLYRSMRLCDGANFLGSAMVHARDGHIVSVDTTDEPSAQAALEAGLGICT